MEKSGLLAQTPYLGCVIIIYTQLTRERGEREREVEVSVPNS